MNEPERGGQESVADGTSSSKGSSPGGLYGPTRPSGMINSAWLVSAAHLLAVRGQYGGGCRNAPSLQTSVYVLMGQWVMGDQPSNGASDGTPLADGEPQTTHTQTQTHSFLLLFSMASTLSSSSSFERSARSRTPIKRARRAVSASDPWVATDASRVGPGLSIGRVSIHRAAAVDDLMDGER